MRWIRVYQGQGPADAHLVHDLLASKGLSLQLRGVGLAGLGGAIPVPDSFPSVWVSEGDVERAREAIAEMERADDEALGWICEACAEWGPPTFDSCWSCGADRPG